MGGLPATRRLFLVLVLLSTGGCAPIYRLEMRIASEPIREWGMRIVVLPPMTKDIGAGPAAVAEHANRAIFSKELAGVKFAGPDRALQYSWHSREKLLEIQRLVTAQIETQSPHWMISRSRAFESRNYFSGESVGDTRFEEKQSIEAVHENANWSIGPERLPPELLSDFRSADLVLVSVPFNPHFHQLDIAALYAVLPFMATKQVVRTGPAVAFILYEPTTGNRRHSWVVIVRAPPKSRLDDHELDPRALPYIGAAKLITQDGYEPLRRVVETPWGSDFEPPAPRPVDSPDAIPVPDTDGAEVPPEPLPPSR